TGGTADRNRSHWSTSKTPSYTKSVSWQHYQIRDNIGTENIFSSFSDFSSFLNEIMDSCS
ncbi:hypothetical protein FCY43_19200, partial [Escherichia coli]|nr:hypothetical protein [Escherichia coli]MDN2410883.1 hypothetical protein [Escherichia coli]MDN2420651.1 hypothetical protein [Escherichia coli]MDN2424982.1 hypothetical protein [Escherichia coli]